MILEAIRYLIDATVYILFLIMYVIEAIKLYWFGDENHMINLIASGLEVAVLAIGPSLLFIGITIGVLFIGDKRENARLHN